MGPADKIIPFIIAAVFGALYSMNIVSGTLEIVLLVLAGIFVLTSLVSFCALYALFAN